MNSLSQFYFLIYGYSYLEVQNISYSWGVWGATKFGKIFILPLNKFDVSRYNIVLMVVVPFSFSLEVAMAARLYSLYQKQGSRWVRVSQSAFTKQSAIRVFQSALLASCFNGWQECSLRPIKNTGKEVIGVLIGP